MRNQQSVAQNFQRFPHRSDEIDNCSASDTGSGQPVDLPSGPSTPTPPGEFLAGNRKKRRSHAKRSIPDIDDLPPNALLTRKQMSGLSNYTEQSLKKWAREGRGPAFVMIEGRPRYPVDKARAWLRGV